MGVVQRNENVLMIVPPPEPITTGCHWLKCIFPANLEVKILKCMKHIVVMLNRIQ
ncbi:ubiquitin-specific protease family C19 protein, partial [Trifolium pratense]